jgi:Leucine-rich repeat (LRR) protein
MATTIVRGITETAQQKQIKRNIVELNLSNQNLKGDLELYNYINLEKLNCSNNQLTGLDLSKLRNLKELNCSDNEITYLDLSQNKKLTKIKYENNLYSSIFLLPEILSSNKIDDL